jgi:hypothetical protein
MNRRELKDQLVAAGVPDGDYFIVGIDSQLTPGKGGGFGELVVAPAEGGRRWRLLSEERGQIRSESVFGTEAEACEEAWARLAPHDRPPPRRRSAEEIERARARAREMIAEYGRLSPEQHGGPGD